MINSVQRTHTGYVRKHNEDSILTHPDCSLFVVADGMGGHAAGDLASQSIINKLLKLKLTGDNLQDSTDKIEATLIDVNDNIHSGIFFDTKIKHKEDKEQNIVAGSTVVIACIVDDVCSCLWVGDSRLYIYRNKKLYQITRDHSLVQEMIDNGQLTAEQAKSHPQTNVITRAIGVKENVQIDINQFEIQVGDKLLLCSDGLYNELTSDTIIAGLKEKKLDKAANKLLGEVLLGEAADNISMIVIENV